MNSGFSAKAQLRLSTSPPSPSFSLLPCNQHHRPISCKIICCDKRSSSADQKFNLNDLGRSLLDNKWKFNEIDAGAMQNSLSHWLSRTRSFFNEVTSPLVKTVNERRPIVQDDVGDMEEIFLSEQTIDSKTPGGDLSGAAIVSIEQFSRMNGLTGKKMQNKFKALVPDSVYNNARNLVEYCCFRFLSRDGSEVHPSLKDPAFQRLIFVTMLAWEHPYCNGKEFEHMAAGRYSLKRKLVGEAAFVRIAPAVSGVAEWSTAHNLFKALARDEEGISYGFWSTYIHELLKIHEHRESYQFQEFSRSFREKVVCLSSSRKPPVLKWENNMVWPGKLTLTDGALYFEVLWSNWLSEVERNTLLTISVLWFLYSLFDMDV